jgi:signal transduction histidine kinase
MIQITPVTAVLCGVVLLALIGAAGYALYQGLRGRVERETAATDTTRLAAMLDASPAAAMLVRGDGRVEMPQRLADWLGLLRPAGTLPELAANGAGLAPEEAAALASDVAAVQRAGRGFVRAVRPIGSSRALVLRGERAPAAVAGSGAVLVWAFDASESENEIARLRDEGQRFAAAFDALTGLIEAAPVPMWHRGADLRLTMVNTAYARAVESTSAADAIARGLELVEASGAGGPLAGAAAAREAARPHEQTVPATIGGERRMLRVVDVPLPSGGVAGFARDIEDAERARGGLKRFSEAQRAMLDRLSAGVAQFGADRALVFCNQPFRRMFAMRSEWLGDRPEFDRVLERMREANRLPEVRDFPGWKAERREWFVNSGEAIEEAWHLPGGIHIRVLAQPLPDGGLLLVFEDRTEQVQLASARDTLLRVRTATFDNLFEALGVFAGDGRLQLWNNRFRALWGFEEEFLASHPRVDAIADTIAGQLRSPARAKLIAELVRSATVDRQQRGGRVALADGRHYEFAAVPLPDGNALFTMLDITDSRAMERALRDRAHALEEADKVKTAFVANMSYELRTPLTSISGFAELLDGGYAGALTEQGKSYVAAILDSVERLGVLVDDVLDLTQNAGDALERVDTDLGSVAMQAADGFRAAARRKGIDFAVEIARSTGRVPGDARRLREAFEHLIRHAIAETPAGGRVLLHTDGNAARARVVVSDNGAGMDAEAAARAFDRFAQAGIASGGDRALGLGLPLAKQFVEAHGGAITLVSEPGQGTLVTVELPRR